MEYSDLEGEEKWTIVAKMTQARYSHGASVVDFEEFKNHCQNVLWGKTTKELKLDSILQEIEQKYKL